jgi:hypothetical protein
MKGEDVRKRGRTEDSQVLDLVELQQDKCNCRELDCDRHNCIDKLLYQNVIASKALFERLANSPSLALEVEPQRHSDEVLEQAPSQPAAHSLLGVSVQHDANLTHAAADVLSGCVENDESDWREESRTSVLGSQRIDHLL